jgi:hypothetical protein
MRTIRILPSLIATVLLTISCGDGGAGPGDSATSTAEATTTTSPAVELEQPAIWPAAGVVFETPEASATDFVKHVFGVQPVLGEFVQGDARSGEIEVFSPGEVTPVSRSLLFLRQLGPHDGWFVIGAANANATISTPETNAEVAAGPLTVEGVARGFETTVVVTAFRAGVADAVFDKVVATGGAFDTPEPYSATIDLTAASPGDVIALLVRGDTGLETDPGEFGAIPVVVAG